MSFCLASIQMFAKKGRRTLAECIGKIAGVSHLRHVEIVLWVCRHSMTACLGTLSAMKARALQKKISSMLPTANATKQTLTLSSATQSVLALTDAFTLQASVLRIVQMSCPPPPC